MKLIALLLVLAMATGTAGCGKTETNDELTPPVIETPAETPDDETIVEEDADKEEDKAPADDEKPDENKKPEEDKKPADTEKPAEKPAETPAEKPAETPAEKPAEKPVETPAEKPEDKPQDAPAAQTVGTMLAAEFDKLAGSGSPLSIAETIANGGSLPFMAGAMEVEPGLLAGFDNYEVTGFKSGAVFQPMIGSIAFVGYVFELEDGVSASDFVANLKQNANKRWNICVEAEETVTSVSGNKVFFVMCPKQFEE